VDIDPGGDRNAAASICHSRVPVVGTGREKVVRVSDATFAAAIRSCLYFRRET